ncbi:peptidylprolyl isomerase [Oceanomicrobium pacificus]|uniref:Parvulin-like PPIase n=1 Tax=Oceanomicrobium pacificus TaxID=2692916 RepID=A0A6B0TMC2_9RHOB|nr:peptidylprolyl isomerase [Oceanomicrobium pacificus]MXU65710.1 hypothetical protein [Oceanomicrobium pacificus]
MIENVKRSFRVLALALAAALGGTVAAEAQNPFSTAILVNNSAITYYDIEQRALFLEALGAPGNRQELAVDQLIDERLKLQAGASFGLELEEESLELAVAQFAESRNLTAAELRDALAQRGIAASTLNDFVKAGVTWREVVQGRFRARATPSDADVDAALSLGRGSTQESVRLSEIAMPFEERGEEATRELAERLSNQLNGRGDFAAAAREYSRSNNAAEGGSLGWLEVGSLPPAIATQILALSPGEVTLPIEIPDGLSILKLHEVRVDSRTAPPELTVAYGQLVIPLPNPVSQTALREAEERAVAVQRELDDCLSLSARVPDFGPGSGRVKPVLPSQLPGDLRQVIDRLDPGETDVVRTADAVRVVMLCDRASNIAPEQREQVRTQLLNQRLNSLSEGYLQELKRNAVVVRQ